MQSAKCRPYRLRCDRIRPALRQRGLIGPVLACLLFGCTAGTDERDSGPNVPVHLWPRVLAHAAAEEMRPPRLACEVRARNETWVAFAEDLRAEDLALRGGPAVEGGAASDREITAQLRARIEREGWPHPCALGDRASKALWFVVQHSPDPALLAEAIAYFEAAADHGFVPRSQVATMEDRILMRAGEPQIYGTQYVCDPDTARRVRWRTADPGGLDDRRREAGLIPAQWEELILNHRRASCAGAP